MSKARRINPFTIDESGSVDAGSSGAYRTIGARERAMKFGHLRDFMRASSMHGLKYAADEEASCFERYISASLLSSTLLDHYL